MKRKTKVDPLYFVMLNEKEMLAVLVALSDKSESFPFNPELRSEYLRVYGLVQGFYHNQNTDVTPTNIALCKRQAE